MIKILVAGGAGYIGSHTVKHLAQAGSVVTTLDIVSLRTDQVISRHAM